MKGLTGVRRLSIAAVGVAACAGGVLSLQPLGVSAQPERIAGDERAATAQATPEDYRYARSLSRVFQDAARRVEPSVVHITTQSERVTRDFFTGRRSRQQASGLGSGVIVSDDGYILTNNHVIEGATQLYAKLFDGRIIEARVVGSDSLRDLAVIKIDATGLVPAKFGDSDALEVGEWVLALGSPFGFDQTVTAGIVSAKGRGLGIVRDEYKDAEEFIQTDAAINPGNSGGPLINLDGEVVGINSAIFSRSGGSVGLGFSIPVRLAQAVYENILRGGRVDLGYLGVRLSDSDGVQVADVVDESPAERAGLRRGDRIVRYQGRPVDDSSQLMRAIQFSPPGSAAQLEVVRDGEPVELNVQVGALTQAEIEHFGGQEITALGIGVITATPEALGTGEGDEPLGVYIVSVEPGSPGAQAGLQRGDIVTAIDRLPVRTVEEFVARLAEAGLRVRIDLRRGELQGYTNLRR